MNNIIEFPKDRARKGKDDLLIEDMQRISDECVDMSQFLLEVIDDTLDELGIFEGEDDTGDNKMDRDLFVITNLLYSMLVRNEGLPHDLQIDLDYMYDKLTFTIDEPEDK